MLTLPYALVRPTLTLILALSLGLGAARPAAAQTTEERFQDLFITAGYATAFGAALGTAMLAWTDNPSANLKFVAVGASLGFLGGSIVGSYVIFSPLVSEGEPGTSTLAAADIPRHGLVIRPTLNPRSKTLSSIESGFTLATF